MVCKDIEGTKSLSMSCVEKACIWPAELNGYCVFHARMFEEASRSYYEERRNSHDRVDFARKKISSLESDHILLLGIVFNRKDKEPFSKSGYSLLGTLEYEQNTDCVKCHECGDFFNDLAHHIPAIHDLSVREYRNNHGLCSKTKLRGLFIGNRSAKRNPVSFSNLSKRPKRDSSSYLQKARKSKVLQRPSEEILNFRNRCNLQIISRISELGRKVGHTPTIPEMEDVGIWRSTLESCFGSASEAIRLAGMEPRRPGKDGCISIRKRIGPLLNTGSFFSIGRNRELSQLRLEGQTAFHAVAVNKEKNA